MKNHISLVLKTVGLITIFLIVATLVYRNVFEDSLTKNGTPEIPSLGEERDKSESSGKPLQEVYWASFAELDLETGEASPSLKEFDQKHIKVPGFAVPLEDNLQSIREFLLVPNAMACIHVPPPPANQMILVKMQQPLNVQQLLGPLWLTGQLHITQTKSQYGAASFEMIGEKVEPYE